MHQNVCLHAFMEEMARRSRASGKSSRLQKHEHLLCLGVLVWQLDVDVANCVSVEVGSTRVSGGNQEKGPQLETRLPDTQH